MRILLTLLLTLALAACTAGDRPIDQATALQWTATPAPAALSVDSPAVRLAAAGDLRPAYETYRDDALGQVVVIYADGSGDLLAYTPTPGSGAPPVTAAPTLSPSLTLTPAPPTPTGAPPSATPLPGLLNGGFEQGLTGWVPYTLSADTTHNLESRATGAQIVYAGDKSLRWIRDVFPAGAQILHAGARTTISGVPLGALVRVTCQFWGVFGVDPFPSASGVPGTGNRIGEIFSQASIGIGAVGESERNGAQVVWGRQFMAARWVTVTAEARTASPSGLITIWAEGQVGQDWAPFPAASVHVDDCRATVTR